MCNDLASFLEVDYVYFWVKLAGIWIASVFAPVMLHKLNFMYYLIVEFLLDGSSVFCRSISTMF